MFFFMNIIHIIAYRVCSIYLHMVIDLKVLVKSFNCEDRSCYAGNPHESFREFAKVKCLFAKVSRKLDIMHQHANRSKGSCKES